MSEPTPEPEEPMWLGALKLLGILVGIFLLIVIVFTVRDIIMLS